LNQIEQNIVIKEVIFIKKGSFILLKKNSKIYISFVPID